ncbi:MAG: PQQ-binding-like beta-propeller repeat protein [Spirochaetaceae bacterium]|jgi:outer membrane protein assembly factor BamB|nr:PQQ-binding-like beta-propeller repeat protein [Spirochaetaceae bacterium]
MKNRLLRAVSPFAALFYCVFAPCHFVLGQSAEEIENSLLWRQTLGGAILAGPSVQTQTASVVCEGGFIRTYGDSGKPLWEYSAPGRLAPFIARSGSGMTFAGRTNGVFYALNRSGRLLWEKRLGEAPAWTPLIGWDGRVFVFLSKKILCFTAAGTQLWEFKLEFPIQKQPVPNGEGGFIVIQSGPSILIFNAFGKASLVELPERAAAVVPVKQTGALVFYHSGEVEIIKNGKSAKKEALKPEPQDAAGKENAEGRVNAVSLKKLGGEPLAAVHFKNMAAVLLKQGELLLWDIDKEAELWRKSAGLGIESANLLFDERGVYLFSMSGAAGWTFDGKTLWSMRINNASSPPVLSNDGILYAGGSNWLLYAYKVERRSLGPAPVFPFTTPQEGEYGLSAPDGTFNKELFTSSAEIKPTLKQIAKTIRAGGPGEDEPFIFYALLAVCSGKGGAEADFLEKLEALRLLGEIGSREITPFLARMLATEQDSNIKAAVAEAIGRIGEDPYLKGMYAFEAQIPYAVDVKNVRLLSAIAKAAGSLCRFSGPPLSETGIRLLVSIAGAAGVNPASDAAKKELAAISKR